MLADLETMCIEVMENGAPLSQICHGVHLQSELFSGLQLFTSVRRVTSFSDLLVLGGFKEEQLAIIDGPESNRILRSDTNSANPNVIQGNTALCGEGARLKPTLDVWQKPCCAPSLSKRILPLPLKASRPQGQADLEAIRHMPALHQC